MCSLPTGNWPLQCSHLGRGLGCSFRILIPSPQCCMLKCELKTFHVWEGSGHTGKGQGYFFFNCRKLTSYTWGWCSLWMTSSQLQLMGGFVPCMRWRCAVMYPTVSSTSYSGHGICLQSLTRYDSPTPVHFNAMDSSDIPARNETG